jgi:hypothetical protein
MGLGEEIPGENSQTELAGNELNETQKDSVKKVEKEQKSQKKKEIQKEITRRFENPTGTVKDYYEYIQRGINETGNFDSNMKKAQKYFPTRPVDKLKSGYRNTKQIQIVKKDGKDTEVTKTLTVTYNLKANKNGEWVITGNTVKEN